MRYVASYHIDTFVKSHTVDVIAVITSTWRCNCISASFIGNVFRRWGYGIRILVSWPFISLDRQYL